MINHTMIHLSLKMDKTFHSLLHSTHYVTISNSPKISLVEEICTNSIVQIKKNCY